MAVQLGDIAPDFTAETTEGRLSLHDYLGDGWGILFSHPADFTPVCTTELGEFARRKDEFAQRNAKLIGVSVDSVGSHHGWSEDIAETQGTGLNYPLVGDEDRTVAEALRDDPPERDRDRDRAHGVHHRTRQDGQAHPDLSGRHRTQRRRDPARAGRAAAERRVRRVDAGELEGRRRRHHLARDLRQRRAERSSPRASPPSSPTLGSRPSPTGSARFRMSVSVRRMC